MRWLRELLWLFTGRGAVVCVTCGEIVKPSEIVEVTHCVHCAERLRDGR